MIKKIICGLIIFYRQYLSGLKPPCCRFYPTCSEYALQAMRKKGLLVGLGVSLWRIVRCHPFSKGGYDPVR